jgi:hypothetical protein
MEKWYLKPAAVIIIILCVGPFALPLVWMSPAFKPAHKVMLTVFTIIFTILSVISIGKTSQLLMQEIAELKQALGT